MGCSRRALTGRPKSSTVMSRDVIVSHYTYDGAFGRLSERLLALVQRSSGDSSLVVVYSKANETETVERKARETTTKLPSDP